jgi:hypothetical protein
MPFDPEHVESESSISAGEDAVETSLENELSENVEGHDNGVVAQAHTVKIGSVG